VPDQIDHKLRLVGFLLKGDSLGLLGFEEGNDFGFLLEDDLKTVLSLTLAEIGEVDRLELGEREASSVVEQRLYLLDQIRSSKAYI
jgi:hypothetical protein